VEVPVDAFRLAIGGPFFELQARLGLLRHDALRVERRIGLYVGLAFGVPLGLAAVDGVALGVPRPFLLDPAVWARFVVAIALFVIMDRSIDQRLRMLLGQFVRAPLIAPVALPAAASAVNRALARKDAILPELICIGLALLISWSGLVLRDDPGGSWLVVGEPAEARFSLAAWWCVAISNPLFWFLMLRWHWRYLVWALLLRDLARLDLRLVATHLDHTGGLAFIGRYPNVFAVFVFALSCVVAAGIARGLLDGSLQTTTYGYLMACWLGIVFGLFVLPLAAFSRPLREFKERTLLASSAQATRRERAREREVLGANLVAGGDAATTKSDDVPDPAAIHEAASKLRTLPFQRTALLPLGAAALLPLVAAGATQIPIQEVWAIAKRLLLL
jgi:hypothetical protein